MSISVVMPTHNAGAFLAPAVDSILQQTHQDLELILVNDHSTDDAIHHLDRSDPRLLVIDAPERGVVCAFNTGMALARGDFIARMDADDLACSLRLETQLAYLKQNPDIAISGCCVELFAAHELGGGNQHYERWLNSLRTPEHIHRALFIESPIPNPGAFFRREALLQLGGYQDPDWPEDYDLYLRADKAGMKMGKPEATLLRWREHPKRLTHTDQRYERLAFQRAKAHYLVQRPGCREHLLIWGTGPTGRDFCDLLQAQGAQVEGFVDVHPRRIGGTKRGLPVGPIEEAASWNRGMVLVAVGARGVRAEIRKFFAGAGREEGRDYLFVA